MDMLHDAIGVLGVLAFLIVVAHSVSQVVVNTSGPLVNVVDVGTNLADTFPPENGMLTILDEERMASTFRFARSIFSRLYILVQYFASSNNETNSRNNNTDNSDTNNQSRRSSFNKSEPRGSNGDTIEEAQNGAKS